MGDNKVIAIKIFYSPAAPLFCKVVLQKVATHVFERTQDASWKIVLYQQWVGNREPVLAGNSYLQEARAIPNPDLNDIDFIEIIANQKCESSSKAAVDAAMEQLKQMFRDDVQFFTSYLDTTCSTNFMRSRL